MPSLIAKRPRLALGVGAVLAVLVLFSLGVAIAPGASGDAPPDPPRVPPAAVRAVGASKPLSVGTVRALGLLPALKAPKRKATPKRRTSRRPSGANPAVPPPVVTQPPVAPPPIAPPPVAPPPGPQTCIGAGCDYG